MDKKIQMAIILVVTFILAICLKNDFVRFLFGFEVLLIVFAIAEIIYLKNKITAILVLPELAVYRDEKMPVKIVINSTAKIPVPRIKAGVLIKDIWSEMSSYATGSFMMDVSEKGEMLLGFNAKYAGAYAVTLKNIVIWDHLGIFHKVIPTAEHTRTMYVLPGDSGIKYMDEKLGNEESEGDESSHIKGQENQETVDIREYREGDMPNHIHWKMSAKMDELMVREIGDPAEKMNRIYVNLQYQEKTLTRDRWDELLTEVAETSSRMLNGKRPHFVFWIDIKIRKVIEYKVTDGESYQEMLMGLFYAKAWRAGEASGILEEIRFDEGKEESLEIGL